MCFSIFRSLLCEHVDLIYTLIYPSYCDESLNIFTNTYILLCHFYRKVSEDINRNNCSSCGHSSNHHCISTASSFHNSPKKERITKSYRVSCLYLTYLLIYSQFMMEEQICEFNGMEVLFFAICRSFVKVFTRKSLFSGNSRMFTPAKHLKILSVSKIIPANISKWSIWY